MLPNSIIGVFVINETERNKTVTDSEISIPGYDVVHRNHNRFGGRVVVFVPEAHPFNGAIQTIIV